MAGDRAAALAILDQIEILVNDMVERFDKDNVYLKSRTAAVDSVVQTGYLVRDLKALRDKCETRVTACQDSA